MCSNGGQDGDLVGRLQRKLRLEEDLVPADTSGVACVWMRCVSNGDANQRVGGLSASGLDHTNHAQTRARVVNRRQFDRHGMLVVSGGTYATDIQQTPQDYPKAVCHTGRGVAEEHLTTDCMVSDQLPEPAPMRRRGGRVGAPRIIWHPVCILWMACWLACVLRWQLAIMPTR